MRWRFIQPESVEENAKRAAVAAKIEAWWREFAHRSNDLVALFARQQDWDLPKWMAQHLQAIHPSLMWEYGPGVHGKRHRLVITPESCHHLRPLVQAILKSSPKLDDWEFYAFRLAEDLEMARFGVAQRANFDISNVHVKIARNDLHRIDLTFLSTAFSESHDPDGSNAAFLATETLLGEECLNNWIGAIEINPIPRKGRFGSLFGRRQSELHNGLPLERMKETVDSLIGSIREQLPDRPHFEWAQQAEWTMWQLKPEPSDDFFGQTDLFVAKSANPRQWTAAHSGGPFCSKRFSRCGETFCYVKIDGSEGLGAGSFADKSEIEDALDEILIPNKYGCHIGGGTGLRYSYIDLALTELTEGIAAIRQQLRAGKVPIRSWIQFFDSDWEAEWVGVYDDTPPPPLPFVG